MEEDTGIDEAKTYTVEKSEKVEPEKDGLSQFRDEEKSLGADMEDLHDETVRETLGKDQVQGNGLFCAKFFIGFYLFIRDFIFLTK
jgi:large subunit ribosomal protein L21